MLLVTAIFVLVQLILALVSPVRFIYFSLWIQTIPYTWNFDAQNVFDTPVGRLAIVAIQLFGFCLACLCVVLTNLDSAWRQLRRFKWHLAFLSFTALTISYAPNGAYGMRMVAKLSGPFLFMIAALAVIKSADELLKMRRAIVGSGCIIIALAFFARFMGLDVDPNVVDTGMAGLGPPGMGPPVFCAHMLPVAMLAMAMYVTGPTWSKLMWLGLTAAVIVLAFQRTSAAALYLGFAVMLFLGTRGVWRLIFPAAGILGLPALIIFSDTFRRRMFFGNESSDSLLADPSKALTGVNSSGRFELWDTVLNRFFKANPLFGSGAGSTQEFLAGQAAMGHGVVHSEYVRLLCEVGLIGSSLFLGAMVAYLWKLGRRRTGDIDASFRMSSLAAIGSLIAYLIYCSTDNAFDYVTQFGIYVFALIAIAEKSGEVIAVGANPDPLREAPGVLFPNLVR